MGRISRVNVEEWISDKFGYSFRLMDGELKILKLEKIYMLMTWFMSNLALIVVMLDSIQIILGIIWIMWESTWIFESCWALRESFLALRESCWDLRESC